MDVLAILGIGALVRFFQRRRAPPTDRPPDQPALAPAIVTPAAQAAVLAKRRLVLCAIYGLLLAFVLALFALIPWPTAWELSAALAPDVRRMQTFVVRNLDAVTLAAVSFALLEPLLVLVVSRFLSGLLLVPYLIGQIARLAWLLLALGYWRIRLLRVRRHWQQHRANLS